MKKLIAVFGLAGVVLSGVAMGMSSASVNDQEVEAKIDARLHDLLVKARLQREGQ